MNRSPLKKLKRYMPSQWLSLFNLSLMPLLDILNNSCYVLCAFLPQTPHLKHSGNSVKLTKDEALTLCCLDINNSRSWQYNYIKSNWLPNGLKQGSSPLPNRLEEKQVCIHHRTSRRKGLLQPHTISAASEIWKTKFELLQLQQNLV
ncbi:hypothetical protein FKM82_007185 [Ascaphus truei]